MGSNFDRKINKIILSSLNAIFIKRLIDLDLFKYINKLDEIINHFAKREEIDNETFYWGNDLAKLIDVKLNLHLPQFSYYDILLLYINFKENGEISKGLALNNINTFDHNINELSKYIEHDFSSHQECMDKIAKIIYYNIFDIQTTIMEKEHEKLKNLFNQKLSFLETDKIEKTQKFKENKKIDDILKEELNDIAHNIRLCRVVLSHLNASEVLDNLENYNLEYPELKGYQQKVEYNVWLSDKYYIENYPTIVFWCYKYNKFFKEFPDFNGNEKEIPFWFFIFRILSSLYSVTIEDKNLYSSTINKIVFNLIKDKLTTEKYQNLGTGWINT